jgi:hypothetical protein
MQKGYTIPILAVLLVLAAGVSAVSAVTLTVGDVNLATDGTTADIPLSLDSGSVGLAGYSLAFAIQDSGYAEIVKMNGPSWADPRFCSIEMSTWTMRVVNVKSGGGLTPSLGSVTVRGLPAGLGKKTTLLVTVNEIDDMNGNAISPTVQANKIEVGGKPGAITVNAVQSASPYGVLNALISIDGTSTGKSTPYTFSDIQPVTHTVRVNLSGYIDAEQRIAVESEKTATANFAMDKPATVAVNSNPTGAVITISAVLNNNDIFLNGIPTGTTNTQFKGMPPGSWKVSVDKVGYIPKSTTKTVAQGLTTTFSFTLRTAGNQIPGAITVSTVDVHNKPLPGATPIIDGIPEEDSTTPTPPIQLEPGTHKVTVSMEGYMTPDPVDVNVQSGINTDVKPFVLKSTSVTIIPRILNIGNSKGLFLAWVKLPDGFKAADVDPKSVVCNGATAKMLLRTPLLPRIFVAIFSRGDLDKTISPANSVKFVLSGQRTTKSGNLGFSGVDYIKVINIPIKGKESCDDADKMNWAQLVKNCMPNGFS